MTSVGQEGRIYEFAYGPRASLQKLTYPDGRSIVLDREKNGAVKKFTGPGGESTEFGYDGQFRPTLVRDALGREYKFSRGNGQAAV